MQLQTFLISTSDILYSQVNALTAKMTNEKLGSVTPTTQYIVVVFNAPIPPKDAYRLLQTFTERGLIADVNQSFHIMINRSDDSYGVKFGEVMEPSDKQLQQDLEAQRTKNVKLSTLKKGDYYRELDGIGLPRGIVFKVETAGAKHYECIDCLHQIHFSPNADTTVYPIHCSPDMIDSLIKSSGN